MHWLYFFIEFVATAPLPYLVCFCLVIKIGVKPLRVLSCLILTENEKYGKGKVSCPQLKIKKYNKSFFCYFLLYVYRSIPPMGSKYTR